MGPEKYENVGEYQSAPSTIMINPIIYPHTRKVNAAGGVQSTHPAAPSRRNRSICTSRTNRNDFRPRLHPFPQPPSTVETIYLLRVISIGVGSSKNVGKSQSIQSSDHDNYDAEVVLHEGRQHGGHVKPKPATEVASSRKLGLQDELHVIFFVVVACS
jgi:hypothetical protein